MARLNIICFLVFIYGFNTEAAISDKRLCADPECSSLISHAKVILQFFSADDRMVSLMRGDTVDVYSKEAGSRKDLWGVVVKGKRGYAPKAFLRESLVIIPTRDLKHVVPTEAGEPTTPAIGVGVSADTVPENRLSKEDVSSVVEVVDGTTLYLNASGDVMESRPIEATPVKPNIEPTVTAQAAEKQGGTEKLPDSLPTESEDSAPVEEELDEAGNGEEDEEEDEDYEDDEEEDEEGDEEEDAQEEAAETPAVSDKSLEEEASLDEVTSDAARNVSDNTTTAASDKNLGQEASVDEVVKDPARNVSDNTTTSASDKNLGQEASVDEVTIDVARNVSDNATTDASDKNLGQKASVDEVMKDIVRNTAANDESEGQEGPVDKIMKDAVGNTSASDKISEQEASVDEIIKDSADNVTSSTSSTSIEGEQVIEETAPSVEDLNTETVQSEESVNVSETEESVVQTSNETDNAIDFHDKEINETDENSLETESKISSELSEPSTDDESEKESIDTEQNEMEAETVSQEDNVLGTEQQMLNETEGTGRDISQANTTPTEQNGSEEESPRSDEQIEGEDGMVMESKDQQERPVEPEKEENQGTGSYFDYLYGNMNQQEKEQTPDASTEHVTSCNDLDDELPITEDPVTEPYKKTEEFETETHIVEEKAQEMNEKSVNDVDEGVENSEPVRDFLSSVTNNVFSLYESMSEKVFGPRVIEEKLELDGTEERKAIEKKEIADGIEEADQQFNFLQNSAAREETSCSSPAASSVNQMCPQCGSPHKEDLMEPLYMVPYLVVTAVTILLFTLGYYYIENKRRDGVLLAKINRLEKALLASVKENSCLQENLEESKERLTYVETSTSSAELVASLEQELEEAKIARRELEEHVASLEKELDTATETGLELNRMLSEFLSTQHGSDSLMKSVEELQKQLDNQRGTITSMNSSLGAKSMENESLQADLNLAEERIKSLEEEVQKVSETLSNMEKEKDDMEREFQQKNQSVETQLMEALESKSTESQRMARELETLQEVLDETRRTLASRDGELEVLRDCLRKGDGGGAGDVSSVNLEELADVGRARAELTMVSRERDSLKERLQGEEEARNLLEDHVRIVSEEVEGLRTKYRDAEEAKVEAQTRLEVLSNYFKEKETQLQKELGLQEAMYVQKEGDAMSTIERFKCLQEEVENYRSQNETLKKEILDQERGLKTQIATLEKKAHENWVVARQAERRLEETKQENGQLRNRLTLVERNHLNNSDAPKLNDRHPLESNGEHPTSPLPLSLTDLPSSPLHYGHPASPPLLPLSGQPPMPPPPLPFPGMYLPPPLHGPPFLPPLPPGDRRPPPLGRMSSPPPSPYGHSPPRSPPRHSYRSTPPRYDLSPDRDRYRHRPSSPHRPGPPFSPYSGWDDHHRPPRSGFRPLRRDSPHEPKGSALSSGHSSESLDKSSRHSGRV